MAGEGDSAAGTMSDFLWYTRLLVWVGCGGLLIEAVTGRSYGYLTVVAVIFLVVGFCGFLGALMLEGRSTAWLSVLAEVPPRPGALARGAADPSTQNRAAPPAGKRLGLTEAAGSHGSVAEQRTTDDPRPVETEQLGAESLSVGHRCPQCGRTLEAGQVAAICWSCDTPHHAACWEENQSHCATPGCAGAGSLEAQPPPSAGQS